MPAHLIPLRGQLHAWKLVVKGQGGKCHHCEKVLKETDRLVSRPSWQARYYCLRCALLLHIITSKDVALQCAKEQKQQEARSPPNSNLPTIPPFITTEFTVKLLVDIGGKGTLDEIRQHVKQHYAGWDEKTLVYLGTSLSRLRASRCLDSKCNYKAKCAPIIYTLREEGKLIIQRSR